jgi:hypothetical protein
VNRQYKSICTGGSQRQPPVEMPFLLAVVSDNRQYKWICTGGSHRQPPVIILFFLLLFIYKLYLYILSNYTIPAYFKLNLGLQIDDLP